MIFVIAVIDAIHSVPASVAAQFADYAITVVSTMTSIMAAVTFANLLL
ncbi:hypothetical protein CV093_15530 [Oceanobacillus sp. 143]|nr:hypothetical protein CV093_15530 [Oceanobacillus sp. 143]